MKYQYAHKENLEDYASGRVFYAKPGYPAFPVRLASEIFQRALAHWQSVGGSGPCTIYDPVCGGAYWLVVLAYLHWDAIAAIYASDFDIDILATAERNLSLITPAGLEQRINEIESLLDSYQKASHVDALLSAKKFYQQLKINIGLHIIEKRVFQADATNPQSMIRGLHDQSIDLVIADVPYSWHSKWQDRTAKTTKIDHRNQAPIDRMLAAFQGISKHSTVIAVVSDKNQKVKRKDYQRLERFRVGKRQITILQAQ